ncbi:MAG: hypothetical protein RLY78_41, partial [Pseudomonadota bacterium]
MTDRAPRGLPIADAAAHPQPPSGAPSPMMDPTAPPIPPAMARALAHADPTWLHPAQRARDLAAATQQTTDLLVIGAGVTGAGVALDAAARGLSVVLVDAGDIA